MRIVQNSRSDYLVQSNSTHMLNLTFYNVRLRLDRFPTGYLMYFDEVAI